MNTKSVIETQLNFYRSGAAGCLFAAHAARDPEKFEWRLSVSEADSSQIEDLIQSAISLWEISTQSIIFPTIVKQVDLMKLFKILGKVPSILTGQEQEYLGSVCVGYRVNLGDVLTSWVTGFGDFDFLPKTRQSVFTEIIFRSKPRPNYTKVMKDSPENVVHLADMEMQGMGESKFKSLWHGSLDSTEKVLGHKPDLRSAAKTSFSVPVELWRTK
jgi:hypothetical protein